MVRLVKGAYWDSEIKRAQVDGLDGYPVYTRKAYTDVAYLACARKLLAAPDAIYPQFATHNAHTLAADLRAGRPGRVRAGQYEFQCLHGMGEPLYEQVVGAPTTASSTGRAASTRRSARTRRCSPTWCAACWRTAPTPRSSTASPTRRCRSTSWSPTRCDGRARAARKAARRCRIRAIPLPRDLFGDGARATRAGLDLADEDALRALAAALAASARRSLDAPRPMLGAASRRRRDWRAGAQPGRPSATSSATCATRPAADVDAALTRAAAARAGLGRDRAGERAPHASSAPPTCSRPTCRALIGLLVREAGKTSPTRVAEVREAVDFLRYYAAQARARLRQRDAIGRSGPVVCISPWNFPLAIFTGQVAAALAAGNAVLAKPAEQTPLIAARGRARCCTTPACRAARCSCCRAAARRSARRWSPTRACRA